MAMMNTARLILMFVAIDIIGMLMWSAFDFSMVVTFPSYMPDTSSYSPTVALLEWVWTNWPWTVVIIQVFAVILSAFRDMFAGGRVDAQKW